jgi:epsin
LDTHYTWSFFSAAPATSNNAEMDLLGSLSDSFSLAIVPTTSATTTSMDDAYTIAAPAPTFAAPAPTFGAAPSAANVVNQVGITC